MVQDKECDGRLSVVPNPHWKKSDAGMIRVSLFVAEEGELV